QAVISKIDAQVVGPGVVAPLIVMKVLAGWRNNRRRCVRCRATPENKCAGNAAPLTSHHQQVGGKLLERRLPVLSSRVRDTEHRGVQDTWRKDMRVLRAQCVENPAVITYKNRIVRGIVAQALRLAEIQRKGILARRIVVIPDEAKVFFDLPCGT